MSREELHALLTRAAARCLDNARRVYCEGPLPGTLLFYVPRIDPRRDSTPLLLQVPASTIKTAAGLVSLVVRSDGAFRPEVRLSPVGVTPKATVLEVTWLSRGGEEWTTCVLDGPEAVPEEPFVLRGPEGRKGWRVGDPTPRLKLPRLQRVAASFEWEVQPGEAYGLLQADPALRLDTAERLAVRIAQGYGPDRVVQAVGSAVRAETNALVRHGFAALLETSLTPEWVELRREWLEDRDATLRASAYLAWASVQVDGFEVLLGRVGVEASEHGQIALMRALRLAIGDEGARYTRLNRALVGRPLTPRARQELARIAARFIA